MFVLSLRTFVLPLAAVLIICALPRAQMAPEHALGTTQKGVLRLTVTKAALPEVRSTKRFAAATDSEAF